VRLLTRGGHDWVTRFPCIEEAALAIGTTVILDGEVVVLDELGRSDFNALQNSLGRNNRNPTNDAVFYAFDLLYHDGRDLTGLELSVRRHLLKELLEGTDGAIRLSEEVDADGSVLFEAAEAHGLEGIIAKRKDKPYRSGRTGDWLKIKCIQRESFFIIGYYPSSGGGIAKLLLGAYQDEEIVYVGSVGTSRSAK
jgi:bifunctional non-homologous end joining protein LigD